LNKVCLDATKGCADNCAKRNISLAQITQPNNQKKLLNFTCCLCEVDPKTVLQLYSQNIAECPYDPNCMNPNCAAYQEAMVINGVELNCQKCEACSKPNKLIATTKLVPKANAITKPKSSKKPECPYDPNCMKPCATYQEIVKIDGVQLSCQKCSACADESISFN
jgi:hypothetical protein